MLPGWLTSSVVEALYSTLAAFVEEVKINGSYATPQQPRRPQRLPKDNGLFPWNQKPFGVILALVVVLVHMHMVAAKPTRNPCRINQHWVQDEDGSTLCIDCRSCPPGQGLSIECGSPELMPFNTMAICVPCPSGFSFSSKEDTSSCTPCASCSKDQVVEQNCSSKWDIKCASRCSSKNRYYDEDKGDCLSCSRCCGDGEDVMKDECKEKLGASSNMICSFDSSVHRCDTSTASQPKPTTVTAISQSTAIYYFSPSQAGLKSEQGKDQDYLLWVIIPTVVSVLMIVGGCFYFFKKRMAETSSWCICNGGRSNPDYDLSANTRSESSSINKEHDGKPQGKSAKTDKPSKVGKAPTESEELLLGEGVPDSLAESLSSIKKESKLLSSLLQSGSYKYLKKICERLDTPAAGVGNYREVLSYYDIDHYEMVSVYEKHSDGPSRALIEHLAAKQEQLTVAEFVSVVRKEASRGDVIELLEKYDSFKVPMK